MDEDARAKQAETSGCALFVAGFLQCIWYIGLFITFPFAIWGASGGDEVPGPSAPADVRNTTIGYGVAALLPALLFALAAFGADQRELGWIEVVVAGACVAVTVALLLTGW
ncbi:MAG: hypothetical protein J2P25_24005 [Nocardiopsaceae bacterium]|nr:hypothetical protein [Nocardiopsaceae bacterium]